VTADPVPDDLIFLRDRQSAVAESDARRIDVNFTFQFLELKTGVRRIAQKETIGAFRVPLRVDWQIRKRSPNCRVVRDCIKAGRLSAASRPSRLPEGLLVPYAGSHRAFRQSSSCKRLRRPGTARSGTQSHPAHLETKQRLFPALSKSVDMPQSYQQAPPAVAGQFAEIDRPVILWLNLRSPKVTEARSSAAGSGQNPAGSRSPR
jgi:hypothetical protein